MYFPFQGSTTETDKLNKIITEGAKTGITHKTILEKEIASFLMSKKRLDMLKADAYYIGEHDVLQKKRKIINDRGELEEVKNLPNNIRIDNQYEKLVSQKVNYFLAKPLTFECEDDTYQSALKKVFNRRFHKLMRNMGTRSVNNGISWLHPHYNERGDFTFKVFPAYEMLVFYKDDEQTIVDYALHIYPYSYYEGEEKKTITKVDIFTANGIEHYIYTDDKQLVLDVEVEPEPYIKLKKGNTITGYNWERVPLIPYRYNENERPLLSFMKSLQDGYNELLSRFNDVMEEDAGNTVLVIHNYDGEDLGRFRQNLATYRTLKVRSRDGQQGGVDSISIEVNKENYESLLTILKKAIIENGKGYDAKDDRMGNNPNQMNIQSMYLDIDLDTNGWETEYQCSFEELMWFVNRHLEHIGLPDFDEEEVNIVFNRDILINEKEVVEVLEKSTYLSEETKVAQHPYVKDVQLELKRKKQEQQEQMNMLDNYDTTFQQKQGELNGEET